MNKLTVFSIFLLFSSSLMAFQVELTDRPADDMQQDISRKPAEIIEFSEVKAGDKVLDLLAGGGYYTELLSRVVGDNGEVVLQVPEAYLKYVDKQIKQRLANNRLKNVTYLQSESKDLKLTENKFDSAFLVLGYHDMFFKEGDWDFTADAVMPQLLKSLKKGGKLLIIDHQAAEGHGVDDTQSLHRIESAFVIKDLEKRGFRLVKQSDVLSNTTDEHKENVFKPELRRKTDRFVMLFEKI